MAKVKRTTKGKASAQSPPRKSGVYRGKLTKTGNSLGFRFESPLFRSHPEFNGNVEAHVIAPGRLLVIASAESAGRVPLEDPVLASFLGLLASDIERNPQRIRPLDERVGARIEKFVRRVKVSDDEDLGSGELL
jgi:hypothetical protein